jgi:hypothetical protein
LQNTEFVIFARSPKYEVIKTVKDSVSKGGIGSLPRLREELRVHVEAEPIVGEDAVNGMSDREYGFGIGIVLLTQE